MSALLLRSLPAVAYRSKPFSLATVPLLYLNFHTPVQLKPLPRRRLSTVSVLTSSASSNSSPSPIETVATTSKNALSFPPLEWARRNSFCGELSESDVGKRVRLCGWVALHRVHGGLTFLNLRDHTGIVQVLLVVISF